MLENLVCGAWECRLSPNHKKFQIIRVAKWYLQKKGYLDREMRFDVLAIRFYGTGKPTTEHILWAFEIEE
ncbi:MAG: hypothetical protein JRI40_06310 [Deltaproteobacteria bacterium]|nr:hypothetical protein [Deltaproteobacteria bacterium]